MKTRYAKPFEELEIRIPYTTGMNPYSGLVDFFENQKLLVKDGNSLRYDFTDGTSIKQYRKEWLKNAGGCLDLMMIDFSEKPLTRSVVSDTAIADYDVDYETGEITINEDNGE
jgi:hypothetical protein